jgi:adenosylmethionine-8-amino-7-oxononanoate aminotransferase
MDYTTSFSKKDLVNFDLEYLWHPFTQMKEWSLEEPLFIIKGEGNYLIDMEGKRYLDGVSSLWANIHGHGREEINNAIEEQLQKIAHPTLLGLSHPLAAILSHRLSQLAPGRLKKVFYSESGSTAVEIAIKMAFQYWKNIGKPQKSGFICLREGYHGDTIGSVSVGGIDLFHKIYSPLLFKSIKAPSPHLHCMHHNIPLQEGSDECAAQIAEILEKHHKETAAFILEPLVQGAGGILPFPPGYLRRVWELCKQHDVLLIADEVAVGFGRTGSLFACQKENVEPDLMCLGKGLTGGYLPLAATLTTERIFDAFWGEYEEQKTFFHGHTYTGNPLACAAALASLDLFKKDQTLENLPPKIRRLEQGLESLSKTDFVGSVRNCGMMAGVEIFEDREKLTPFPPEKRMGHKVCMAIRRHGVILRNLGDVIVFMPPLTVTLDELDHMIKSLKRAIYEVCV